MNENPETKRRDEASRPIVRRRTPLGVPKGLDLPAMATIIVTSEQAQFPIDNVFDDQRGPGGSCWMAAVPGPQDVTLVLEPPRALGAIIIESELHGQSTQEVALEVHMAPDDRVVDLGSRSFAFRTYGPSFCSETWTLPDGLVSEVRLRLRPGSPAAHATLTSVVIR